VRGFPDHDHVSPPPDGQLSLFPDDDDPIHSDRSTAAPRVDTNVAQLGERLRERFPSLRLGTSSWTFPGWSGIVYAPSRRGPVGETMLRRDGLRAYAQHPLFRTVGVDRSYYGPLSREAWAAYARQVPDDFRFLIKADRALTTAFERNGAANPRFLDAKHAIDLVLAPTVAGLGERMGVVAIQFPPLRLGLIGGTTGFLDALAPFLHELDTWRRGQSTPFTLAIELRNVEPYEPRHIERLRDLVSAADTRLIYCHHPAAPPINAQRELFPAASQPEMIIRWMLRRNHHYEEAADSYRPFDRLAEPDLETREAIAQLIRDARKLGRTTYLIANNKAEGCSPLTIEELARVLDHA